MAGAGSAGRGFLRELLPFARQIGEALGRGGKGVSTNASRLPKTRGAAAATAATKAKKAVPASGRGVRTAKTAAAARKSATARSAAGRARDAAKRVEQQMMTGAKRAASAARTGAGRASAAAASRPGVVRAVTGLKRSEQTQFLEAKRLAAETRVKLSGKYSGKGSRAAKAADQKTLASAERLIAQSAGKARRNAVMRGIGIAGTGAATAAGIKMNDANAQRRAYLQNIDKGESTRRRNAYNARHPGQGSMKSPTARYGNKLAAMDRGSLSRTASVSGRYPYATDGSSRYSAISPISYQTPKTGTSPSGPTTTAQNQTPSTPRAPKPAAKSSRPIVPKLLKSPAVSQSRTQWVAKGTMVNGKAVPKGYLAQYGKPGKRVTANVRIETPSQGKWTPAGGGQMVGGTKKGEVYAYKDGRRTGAMKKAPKK